MNTKIYVKKKKKYVLLKFNLNFIINNIHIKL
jgi:hypothetical protein